MDKCSFFQGEFSATKSSGSYSHTGQWKVPKPWRHISLVRTARKYTLRSPSTKKHLSSPSQTTIAVKPHLGQVAITEKSRARSTDRHQNPKTIWNTLVSRAMRFASASSELNSLSPIRSSESQFSGGVRRTTTESSKVCNLPRFQLLTVPP